MSSTFMCTKIFLLRKISLIIKIWRRLVEPNYLVTSGYFAKNFLRTLACLLELHDGYLIDHVYNRDKFKDLFFVCDFLASFLIT
jgi:hypothetical protein